ncbi:MAG: hypothetical protein WAN35_07135 [Terracidiphilus sp.]
MMIVAIAKADAFDLDCYGMPHQKRSRIIQADSLSHESENIHYGTDTVLGENRVELRERRRGSMRLNCELHVWSPISAKMLYVIGKAADRCVVVKRFNE